MERDQNSTRWNQYIVRTEGQAPTLRARLFDKDDSIGINTYKLSWSQKKPDVVYIDILEDNFSRTNRWMSTKELVR